MGILPDTSPMSPEICGNPHRLQISVAFDSPQYDVINATLARPPAFPQHLTSPLSIVSQGRAPVNTENHPDVLLHAIIAVYIVIGMMFNSMPVLLRNAFFDMQDTGGGDGTEHLVHHGHEAGRI